MILSIRFIAFAVSIGTLAIFSTWNAFKNKTHPRYWKICALLIWSSLLCFLLIDPNTVVDQNGIVHEPIAIFLLGVLTLFSAIISLIIFNIAGLYRYIRNRR